MSKYFLYKSLNAKQQGLSLIELMIAMSLGFILTAGVLQVFQSLSLTFKHNGQLARIQENGRFSLELLSRDIHMAGYRDPDKGELLNFFYVEKTKECNASDKHCTNDGGLNESDRIAVQLEAVNKMDCTGYSVGEDRVVVNVYYLDKLENISTLYCRGFDPATKKWISTAAPLIAGIDNFQILYGVAGADGSVTQYVNATAVEDWVKVRAVKIGMLVNSGDESGSLLPKIRSYSVLDSGKLTFNDHKSRYIYSTTFSINNASLDMIGSI